MDKVIDLERDYLAGAALSPEQRSVWEKVRSELKSARLRLLELEAQVRLLENRSREDPDTHSILTRPDFNREVARMLAFDERYGGMSSVLYFDFENLEDILTLFDDHGASSIIAEVCDSLSKSVRASDIIGRLAPNEFGALLVRCNNDAAWKKGSLISNRLQDILSTACAGKIVPVINFGAYTFREGEDAPGGIKNAAAAVTRGTSET